MKSAGCPLTSQPSLQFILTDFDEKLLGVLERQISARLGDHHKIIHAESQGQEELRFDCEAPDLIIIHLSPNAGFSAMKAMRDNHLEVPILVVAKDSSAKQVSAAIHAGADDFIELPVVGRELAERIERLTTGKQLNQTRQTSSRPSVDDILIGRSPLAKALRRQVQRIALARAPIFISGEAGSGKEVLARAIHGRSGRASGPFVVMNTSSMASQMMEYILSGKEDGQDTDSSRAQVGLAAEADGGTLYIEDICSLDHAAQVALLRYLETGLVQPVGAIEPTQRNLRVIAATTQDPRTAIDTGRLRADLFFRLNVLPLCLPRLADRHQDIGDLTRHLVQKISFLSDSRAPQIDARTIIALEEHSWTGGLSELQSVLHRALVIMSGDTLCPDHLVFEDIKTAAIENQMAENSQKNIIETVAPFHIQERKIIEEAICHFDGNITRAADALQISASTIHRKRSAWNSEPTVQFIH